MPKHSWVKEAIKRGISFEVTYSDAIKSINIFNIIQIKIKDSEYYQMHN